jgi:primosomal protein N' (replication factor Y)
VFVAVAVPVPNLDLLTYAVADGVDRPAIGARVLVPLGTRVVTGIVIDHVDDPGAARDMKLVQKVLDAHAFVPAEVVGLARWTAEYYAAGVGDTIPALLPPMARGGRVDAHKTQRIASITPAGLEALQLVAPKQREALELLAAAPDGIPTPTLTARGIAGSAITRLVRHGYISVRTERLARDPFALRSGSDPDQIESDPDQIRIRSRPGCDA